MDTNYVIVENLAKVINTQFDKTTKGEHVMARKKKRACIHCNMPSRHGSFVCNDCLDRRLKSLKNKVRDVEGKAYDESLIFDQLIDAGYTIKENGDVIGPRGKMKLIKRSETSVCLKAHLIDDYITVKADRMAAYIFYGMDAIEFGKKIKFRDGNITNLSKDNLKITS